jgi:hypothetical protein
MWFPIILIFLLLLLVPREGFKLHVEGDLGDFSNVHRSTTKWISNYAKRGRAFVWDMIPLKHVYRRWRKKKNFF